MLGVAQHADDLGRQHRLQDLDGLLDIADIVAADGAVIEVWRGPLAQGLDIGQKRLGYRCVIKYLLSKCKFNSGAPC